MVAVQDNVAMMMSTSPKPCCFIDFSSIGCISPIQNKKVSANLATIMSEHCDITKERCYINFTDVERANWGFNGTTFAG